MEENNVDTDAKQRHLEKLKKQLARQERKFERSLRAKRAKDHVRRKLKEYKHGDQLQPSPHLHKTPVSSNHGETTLSSSFQEKITPLSLKLNTRTPSSSKLETRTHSKYDSRTPSSTKFEGRECKRNTDVLNDLVNKNTHNATEAGVSSSRNKNIPSSTSQGQVTPTSSKPASIGESSFSKQGQVTPASSTPASIGERSFSKQGQVTPASSKPASIGERSFTIQGQLTQGTSLKSERIIKRSLSKRKKTAGLCDLSPSSRLDDSGISQSSADVSRTSYFDDSLNLTPTFNAEKLESQQNRSKYNRSDGLQDGRHELKFKRDSDISFSSPETCDILSENKNRNNNNVIVNNYKSSSVTILKPNRHHNLKMVNSQEDENRISNHKISERNSKNSVKDEDIEFKNLISSNNSPMIQVHCDPNSTFFLADSRVGNDKTIITCIPSKPNKPQKSNMMSENIKLNFENHLSDLLSDSDSQKSVSLLNNSTHRYSLSDLTVSPATSDSDVNEESNIKCDLKHLSQKSNRIKSTSFPGSYSPKSTQQDKTSSALQKSCQIEIQTICQEKTNSSNSLLINKLDKKYINSSSRYLDKDSLTCESETMSPHINRSLKTTIPEDSASVRVSIKPKTSSYKLSNYNKTLRLNDASKQILSSKSPEIISSFSSNLDCGINESDLLSFKRKRFKKRKRSSSSSRNRKDSWCSSQESDKKRQKVSETPSQGTENSLDGLQFTMEECSENSVVEKFDHRDLKINCQDDIQTVRNCGQIEDDVQTVRNCEQIEDDIQTVRNCEQMEDDIQTVRNCEQLEDDGKERNLTTCCDINFNKSSVTENSRDLKIKSQDGVRTVINGGQVEEESTEKNSTPSSRMTENSRLNNGHHTTKRNHNPASQEGNKVAQSSEGMLESSNPKSSSTKKTKTVGPFSHNLSIHHIPASQENNDVKSSSLIPKSTSAKNPKTVGTCSQDLNNKTKHQQILSQGDLEFTSQNDCNSKSASNNKSKSVKDDSSQQQVILKTFSPSGTSQLLNSPEVCKMSSQNVQTSTISNNKSKNIHQFSTEDIHVSSQLTTKSVTKPYKEYDQTSLSLPYVNKLSTKFHETNDCDKLLDFNKKPKASSAITDHQFVEYSEFTELDIVEFSQFKFSEEFLSSENSETSDAKSKRRRQPNHLGMIIQRRSPRVSSNSSLASSQSTTYNSYSESHKSVRLTKAEKCLKISSVFQFLVDDARRVSETSEFYLPVNIFKHLKDLKLSQVNNSNTIAISNTIAQSQGFVNISNNLMAAQRCDNVERETKNCTNLNFNSIDTEQAQNLDKKNVFVVDVVYDSEPIEDDSLSEEKCYHRNDAMEMQEIDVSVISESDNDKPKITEICDRIQVLASSDSKLHPKYEPQICDVKNSTNTDPLKKSATKNDLWDNICENIKPNLQNNVDNIDASEIITEDFTSKYGLGNSSEVVQKEIMLVLNKKSEIDSHNINEQQLSVKTLNDDFTCATSTPKITNISQYGRIVSPSNNTVLTPKPFRQSKLACDAFTTPKDSNIRKRFDFPADEFSPTLFNSQKGTTPIKNYEKLLDDESILSVDLSIQFDDEDDVKTVLPTDCLKLCRDDAVIFVAGGSWSYEGEEQLFVVCILPSVITVFGKGQGDWENELDWFLSPNYQATDGWIIRKQNKIVLIVMEEDRDSDQRFSLFYYDLMSGDSNTSQIELQADEDCPITGLLCCVLNSDEIIVGYNHPTSLSATKHILTDAFKQMKLCCHLEKTSGFLLDIQEVRHLECCVVGLTAKRDAIIWNHEEGFLLKKIDLSSVITAGVSLTAVHQIQGYLLLYLVNKVKNSSPGYLVIVNPVDNKSLILHDYQPLQHTWRGMKSIDTVNDMQLAVDINGNTGLWDMISGELLADLPRSKVTCVGIGQSDRVLYLGLECGVIQIYCV